VIPDRRTALAVVFTIVVWASAFPGIRAALQDYAPGPLILLRFLVASAALGLLAATGRVRRAARADLPRLALSGFLGITVYQLTLNFGQLTVMAGTASLLVNTAPIWAALLAGPLLGERLTLRQWAGIFIGFAGVALIVASTSRGIHLGRGAWLILGSAWAHGASFLIQKPLFARMKPEEVIAYTIWFGTLFCLPWLGHLPSAVAAASPKGTWTVVYLGVAPAAFAYVSWAYVLSRFSAARAASFLYGVPVCSLLIAWWWLGEVPHVLALAGGTVAMSGVALVHSRRTPASDSAA
jgi:drug/metabolite transporter (DMT)-like permease